MARRWILLLLALALALVPTVARADNIGGAGDISNDPVTIIRNDQATAKLLETNGIGLVHTYGDNQYECGQLINFLGAYDKSWGRLKAITRPSPGNHEYLTSCPLGTGTTELAEQVAKTLAPQDAGGAAYYDYFAGRTPPHPGYYQYSYQGWDFFVLNTTFGVLTPEQQTAQLAWFKNAIRASRLRGTKCQVVYGHHPYKATASPFTGTPALAPYWTAMVQENVDAYFSGHNHSYERGKPIRTMGNVDYTFGPGSGGDGKMGVRWYVVGTGGRSLIPFTGTVLSSSSYRLVKYGIIKIVPYPTAFLTAFKGADGSTHDRVNWGCH